VSPWTAPPAWRWGNIPIPEGHLAGLGTGILLQVVAPWRLPCPAWVGHGCGWPLLLVGLALGTWAVRTAAGVDLDRPGQLVASGPYAHSRNPMYVAWTVGYVGAALVAGTAWPLLLLPVVLVVTQVVVLREERSLERRFGVAYRNYKASVRRYL
jgi:protein-S-isoprenylcysteine O-methyltransferase Ste14